MKTAIEHARQLLFRGEFGTISNLRALWNKIEWEFYDKEHSSAVELDRSGGLAIHVYVPTLRRLEVREQDYAILREFGNAILRKSTPDARQRWERKLALPTKEQLDNFQRVISSKDFKKYDDIVQEFSGPIDRLVAINLVNAFVANCTSVSQLKNLDIRVWGPTRQYASGQRYHSLIPIISPYTPSHIFANFGEAFADGLVWNYRFVRHTNVAQALRSLLLDIAKTVRP